MKKLTGQEIIDTLRESISPRDFAYDYELDKLGLGEIKSISNQTGDINSTTYCHVVRLFVDHNVYIKLEGWYSSYSGSREFEDDEYSVVEPVEKVITIWE